MIELFKSRAFKQLTAIINAGANIYNTQTFSFRQVLCDEARKHDLTVKKSLGGKGVLFFNSNETKVGSLFSKTSLSLNSKDVSALLKNKLATVNVLKEKSVRFASHAQFDSAPTLEQLKEYDLEFPLVAKPLLGHGGIGITTSIQDFAALDLAFRHAQESFDGPVLLEPFFSGVDVRCYMVGGQLVAACARLNAHVTGDGRHNVAELINLKNTQRERNPHLKRFPILCSELTTLQLVPAEGEIVQLSNVSNLHQGGESVEVTALINDALKIKLTQVCEALGATGAIGLDIILDSFLSDGHFTVIEANANANIGPHHYPLYGQPQNVAKAIIAYMIKTVTPN
jgi:D-alanine-D-alanine ligase-like ATP-grasp enzyme